MNNFQGINFKIVKDINQAKELWNQLSPNETIYDSWDFRYCFYKYFNYELFFYVGYVGDEVVGLLPLELNSDSGCLEFFGTYYMETNRVFIKFGFEYLVSNFFSQVDRKASLEYMREPDEVGAQFQIQDYKYILELNKFSSFNDYFEKEFSAKSRSSLKKKIFQIEGGNEVLVLPASPEEIEILFDYSIKTFQSKNDQSSFEFLFRKEIFRDLLNLGFETQLLKFIINGKNQAVSISFLYNGSYVFLNTGANIPEIPNLGTYVYLKNIEQAFSLKANYFDAGVGSYNWKERFHLTKIPQYKFEK